MWRYVLQRLLLAIPTLLGVSVISFAIVHLIPGDPITIMFGTEPDPVAIARLQALYGLDQPVHVQYFTWLKNMLSGNMGNSIRLNLPIAGMIAERLPRTLVLTGLGALVSLCIAVPAGVLAAYRQNSWLDLLVSGASLLGMAMPNFWQGIMLLILFGVVWPIFPLGGWVDPTVDFGGFFMRLVLPAITLGLALAAVVARITRSSMLEVLRQEYVTVARAKGLRESAVVIRHALRNALIPTLTVVAMQIGYLMGGTIVIERVFAYPGQGLLLLSAVQERDYPLIQAQVLVFAAMFVLINLLTDLLYSVIDPRVRYQ